MAKQPVGYFDYNGDQRYSDGRGGIYHNHLGPALNSIGDAFGIKSAIKNSTDIQHKRLNDVYKNKGTNTPIVNGLTPAQIKAKSAENAKRIQRIKDESDKDHQSWSRRYR